MKVTMEILFFLFLVPGRSHVIALRGRYNDDCKRQHEEDYPYIELCTSMKDKRRSTHAEGAYDSKYYIASEGVKLQRDHVDSE
jgi:hypothetical protein